jgi:MtN3 and saliva related transmembrane protein
MEMTQDLVEWIGLIAGTCTTLSFVPQLITVFRHRSARDISYGWLAVFTTGVIFWLWYGLLLLSVPVILANAVTLSLLVVLIALKVKYDREARPRDEDV